MKLILELNDGCDVSHNSVEAVLVAGIAVADTVGLATVVVAVLLAAERGVTAGDDLV